MIHVFQPDKYYLSIGSHSPALEINSGDTVTTTTVDAGGFDKNGVSVSERGNPQTGPIYVKGASPGTFWQFDLTKYGQTAIMDFVGQR